MPVVVVGAVVAGVVGSSSKKSSSSSIRRSSRSGRGKKNPLVQALFTEQVRTPECKHCLGKKQNLNRAARPLCFVKAHAHSKVQEERSAALALDRDGLMLCGSSQKAGKRH